MGDPISAPNTSGSVDPLVALGSGPARPSLQPISDRVPELHGSYFAPMPLSPATAPSVSPPMPPTLPVAASPIPVAPSAPPAGLTPGPIPGPTAPQVEVRAPSPPVGPRPTGTMFKSWESPETSPRTTTLTRVQSSPTGPTPIAVPSAPTAAVRDPVRVPEPSPASPSPAPSRPTVVSKDELRAAVEEAIDAHPQDFQLFPNTRPTDRLSALNEAAVQAAVAAGLGRQGAPGQTRDFELLKAFLLGAGLPELPKSPEAGQQAPSQLTPELMRRIGTILRISTKGTRDLLQARAMLKREMRTRMTMIVPRDNNPIKFSPDVASTLTQLLAPRALRGFLEPVPAVQEAYNDLLAHQVGFVAGMRAAIQGMIERFDPGKLEGRLTKKSMVDSLVPMSRRAKLWELYGELYSEIAKEAEDDFDALFGRAFVQAYEEQVSRLEKSGDA